MVLLWQRVDQFQVFLDAYEAATGKRFAGETFKFAVFMETCKAPGAATFTFCLAYQEEHNLWGYNNKGLLAHLISQLLKAQNMVFFRGCTSSQDLVNWLKKSCIPVEDTRVTF